MLLGQVLSGCGIDFIECKAHHRKDGAIVVEMVLVRSEADVGRMREFLVGLSTRHETVIVPDGAVRIATAEEVRAHDEVPW